MARIKIMPSDEKLIVEQLHDYYTGIADPDAFLDLIRASVPEIRGSIPFKGGVLPLVSKAVEAANMHGILDRLLVAAAADRPYVPELRSLVMLVSQRPGWSVPTGTHGLGRETFERLTSHGNPFLDVSRFARWMLGVERHVCQVYVGREEGTGFLIGPDLVLTNYHVVRAHLNGDQPPENVKVRFDFRVSPAGVAPDPKLPWLDIDQDWKIPFSPYSLADTMTEGEPTLDELDYAILKLKSSIGSDKVDGGGKRGWVDVSHNVDLPPVDSPILIVQHPGQPPEGTSPLQPMKIAFATPGFQNVNANGTRVAYSPSTLKGSSGSPVFSSNYKCVALHHNGGQSLSGTPHLAANNRGIPIKAIRNHLTEELRAMLVAP